MQEQKPVQQSLWTEQGTPEALRQAAPVTKRTRRGVALPMATAAPLFGSEQPGKMTSLAQLQEFVRNYQYKELPIPIRSEEHGQGARIDSYEGGYEIRRSNPATKTWLAATHTEQYVVSLSGGLGSAIAAERAIKEKGRDNVLLWFADTKEENADLYRFLHDVMGRWKGVLYWYTDGRKPPMCGHNIRGYQIALLPLARMN